ncbi:unnamed protein product [Strongylus vulgaris]|uniref:Uncharacterized protein n=1 Tax=Strongylus vulgaris TaxID=40348 RepID=A0A3P7J4T9_STRVU|nr:unnamed protein product [Strongylus vulgaris]
MGDCSLLTLWTDIVHLLASRGFTRVDLAAFRYLALFHEDGKLFTAPAVSYSLNAINFRSLAQSCQNFLIARRVGGVVGSSLLAEMLSSSIQSTCAR